MKVAHYLFIIASIFTFFLVWERNIVTENKQLDNYSNCLDKNSKCYCDSILLQNNQYYDSNKRKIQNL